MSPTDILPDPPPWVRIIPFKNPPRNVFDPPFTGQVVPAVERWHDAITPCIFVKDEAGEEWLIWDDQWEYIDGSPSDGTTFVHKRFSDPRME